MKKYLIKVNGNQYEVEVEEVSNDSAKSKVEVQPKSVSKPEPKVETKKEKPKPIVNTPQGTESVDAPMPGTIFNINVSEGEEVKAGQVLLILEAMKMENEIVSPRDGKVVAVHEEKGAAVNTGDKLVSIE